MACPLTRTEEGLEMQIGTNHFGHFLLTNLLMPLLKKAAPDARIVNVSSLAHERGRMFFDDINYETRPYKVCEVVISTFEHIFGIWKLLNMLFVLFSFSKNSS